MSRKDVEQLTARGSGGVAVLALLSPRAEEALTKLFDKPLPAAGAAAFGGLHAGESGLHAGERSTASEAPEQVDEQLDEVLVVRRPDHVLELHLHGNQALVDDVHERLCAPSGGPGERSEESVERTAARLAARAPTTLGARLLVDQAEGVLRRGLAEIAALPAPKRARACASLARAGRRALPLYQPATVVLAGPVNAGKSTLFNVLVGADEALVHASEGTTRDTLAGHGVLGLWPVVLVDTAGIRALRADALRADPQLALEAAGMQLAQEATARADVTIHLQPPGAEDSALPPDGVHLVIRSRCAEAHGRDPSAWPAGGISAHEDPGHARKTVAGAVAKALGRSTDAGQIWSPGTPVPFTQELVGALEAFAARDTVPARALDALLGPV